VNVVRDGVEYARVAACAAIAPGGVTIARVGGYEVAVFNLGDAFVAYENVCPHQGGPIGEGFVEDGTVTCPWHAWCFDLRTGTLTIGAFARLRRFGVRVEEESLLVTVQPIPSAA